MNNFSLSFMPKTDLATEIHEFLSKKNPPDIDGLCHERKKCDILEAETVTVLNDDGAKKAGKPVGRYTTVNVGRLTGDTNENFKRKCIALSKILSEFIPKEGACLFAGIGNRKITADATGPECADRIIVTRHIKSSNQSLFSAMGLRETMCVATDVLGNTGLEAAELLRGVVKDLKPAFIVAVDALATSSLSRLATTVQICDTGISPGSGINNRRLPITSEVMGIPVFALGIPTVADIVSVAGEFFSDMAVDNSADIQSFYDVCLKKVSLSPGARFITPKDSDAIIRASSKLMAYSLNLALHKGLSYEDMCDLLGG